jgi:excisionase family DNA binding protein
MTGRTDDRPVDRLLTVAEAAQVLSTTEHFPRRLIGQRRIRFVRVGRHVRIPESALREFLEPILDTGSFVPKPVVSAHRQNAW